MNIDKKFLLVCLQLIIVLVMSMIVEGMMLNAPISEPARNPLATSSSFRPKSLKRAMRLFHGCSKKVVRVKERVSATSINESYGDLVLESMVKRGILLVRIKGLKSGEYVCYNRRGRLIAKPEGSKTRGAKCEFREQMVGGNFRFLSVHNPNWTIGFNDRGHPLKGPMSNSPKHKESCFEFSKLFLENVENGFPDILTQHRPDVEKHNDLLGNQPSIIDPRYSKKSSRTRRPKKSQHHLRHQHHGRQFQFHITSVADR